MTSPRRATRWLVLLVAISLQGQALAGLLIPCLHQTGMPAGAVHEPCHQQDATAQDRNQGNEGIDPVACVKCSLSCHGGASHPPAGWPVLTSYIVSGQTNASPQDPFYRFVPEPLRRPPIHLSV